MMKAYSICSLASALIFSNTGCDRNHVKVYRLEPDDASLPAPGPVTSAAMPDSLPAPDNRSQPSLKYILPAGWKEKALTQMRVASFEVSENGKTADFSIIPLGGTAGGDFANVNRWRGQVGQPPLDETESQKLAERVEVAGQPSDLYDVTGTTPGSGDPERIIGVILHRGDTAWFFKLTGDPDLVEKQKPAFTSFLKSLEFGGPACQPAGTVHAG